MTDTKEILGDTFAYDGLSLEKVENETITLFDKEYTLPLSVFYGYHEDGRRYMLRHEQKATYKIFKDILKEEKQNIIKKITEFAKESFESFDSTEDCADYIEPIKIHINKKGELGIVFKTKYKVINSLTDELTICFTSKYTPRSMRILCQELFIHEVTIDETFGKVAHNGLYFYKMESETIKLFNKEYNFLAMNISGVYDEKLKKDIITDQQRETYKVYKDVLKTAKKDIALAITTYAKEYFEDFKPREHFSAYLQPDTISIDYNGRFGILCETKYDIDHGFVIYFESNETCEPTVGTQDLFL